MQVARQVLDDPIQFGYVTSSWAKLNNQLNTLVRAVQEAIEGSKMIEGLTQGESSSINVIRVDQDIGQKTYVQQGVCARQLSHLL